MRALIAHKARGALAVENVDDPVCPADGAIIRIKACGVCRSDHHAWEGVDPDVSYPHIMGHELAGVVEEVGPNTKIKKGQRVTAPFILGCGACIDCRSGNATICNSQNVIGFTMQGAFAELIAVPNADFNLVALPDEMDFDTAAGMGCRVTTAFRAVVERGGLKSDQTIAIFGAGGVGLSAVMIANALGANVIAVDVSDEALELAKKLGAHHLINSKDGHAPDRIVELTNGGADLAIEALGKEVTFDQALRSLRKLGRYVQIGMPTGKDATPTLPLLDLVYSRQLSIHGTRGIAPQGFTSLMHLVSETNMPLDKMITDRINLMGVEPALLAMEGAQAPGISVVTEF